MKKQIFIGGSIKLIDERSAVKSAILHLNNDLESKDVILYCKTHEDFPAVSNGIGHQNEYDYFISDYADYSIFVFRANMGDKTREELEVALKSSKDSNNRKKVLVFYDDRDATDELIEQVKKLTSQYGLYCGRYKGIEHLESLVKDELRKSFDKELGIVIRPEEVYKELVKSLVPGFCINSDKQDYCSICKYPVTQRQWTAIMGSCPVPEINPNHPVTNITIDEVDEFIARLNKCSGDVKFELINTDIYMKRVELLLKKMAKLDELKELSNLDDYFWYDANSNNTLHDVGTKEPIAGLYDVFGLVYEYDQDSRTLQNLYGGAFNTSKDKLSTDYSNRESSYKYNKRHNNVGFRLAAMIDIDFFTKNIKGYK